MANLSVRGVAKKSLHRIKQTARRRGVSVNRLITEMENPIVSSVLEDFLP